MPIKKFQIKDVVVLLPKAESWKPDNGGGAFYHTDGLEIGKEYVVENTCSDNNTQIISIEGALLSYPDWCFDIVSKSNSGEYELEPDVLKISDNIEVWKWD